MKRFAILSSVLLLSGVLGRAGPTLAAPASAMTPGDALLPAPEAVETPAASGLQTAVFAGGCFWGVQGVFQHVRGVVATTAGYDGGKADTAQYETVSTGSTGHAESVKVVFDSSRISYGQLLRVFFSVVLDPTQLGGQYPDQGSQYRSVVFATSSDQARIARAYVAQLDAAHLFARPIATQVVSDRGFYRAEDYHQNFLDQHPDNGYITTFDQPKLDALRSRFPDRFVSAPVLATATPGVTSS